MTNEELERILADELSWDPMIDTEAIAVSTGSTSALWPTPGADDVQPAIEKAFTRDATLDADDLVVATSNATATLTGTVHSWSERDAVVAAAWAAPGVATVDDRLTVTH